MLRWNENLFSKSNKYDLINFKVINQKFLKEILSYKILSFESFKFSQKKTLQSNERRVCEITIVYAFTNKPSIALLNVSLGLNDFVAKSLFG